MSAYNVVRLWCDRRDSTGRECTEKFEVVAPGIEFARRLAAKKGWTFTGSGPEEDYCPDHNPATESNS